MGKRQSEREEEIASRGSWCEDVGYCSVDHARVRRRARVRANMWAVPWEIEVAEAGVMGERLAAVQGTR